jgi:hypothetical protein
MNDTKVKLKAVVLTQFMLAFGEEGREPNEAQRALVDKFAEDLEIAAESFPDEMDVSIIDDIYTLLDAIDEIPEAPEDEDDDDSLWLQALEDAGVYTWQGIEYAQEIYRGLKASQ